MKIRRQGSAISGAVEQQRIHVKLPRLLQPLQLVQVDGKADCAALLAHDLGHMGFVTGLLEGQEDSVRKELLTEIGRKNAPAIRTACAQAGIGHNLAEALCRLALLYGTPDQVLPHMANRSSAPVHSRPVCMISR